MPNNTTEKLMCPFCGTTHVVADMVEWEARSLEPQDRDNTATLSEPQCQTCHRSFWT